MFTLIAHRKIVDALQFLDQIYAQMPQHDIEQRMIFDKFIKTLRKPLVIMFIIYATIHTIAFVGLMLWNVFSVEYRYVAPIYLPGLPVDTTDGFELNMIWHFCVSLYAAITYSLFDGLNVVLLLHVLLLTNLLRHEFRGIDHVASTARHMSDVEVLRGFKNAVEQQIQLRKYVPIDRFHLWMESIFVLHEISICSYIDRWRSIFFYPLSILVMVPVVSLSLYLYLFFSVRMIVVEIDHLISN